ncbi:MAG TPA: BON domain-containing protein [Gemmatimonadales bacterium]|nr:BON domain-containing protein [Gemmatimonadales bacterium]
MARKSGGKPKPATKGSGKPAESSEDDAPSGDWQRHGTGAGSAGRGQEGLSFPEQRGGGERRIGQRRRPDDALARELLEILTKDPELDATEIEVEVEGGAVTLRGVVDSSDARLLAEELVESVTGVREVHNNLKVAR